MNEEMYRAEVIRTCRADLSEEQRLHLAALGLAGEAGEIANLVKKCLFHQHGQAREQEHLLDELGDVLWYATLLCITLDSSLEAVIQRNVEKLRQRYPAGFDPERSIHRDA